MARLTAALYFYETKYPQGDEEGLCGLADRAMKPEKDGEIVEQLKVLFTLWYCGILSLVLIATGRDR